MSAYSQQTKRQKVRESKVDTEYFQGIDKLEYNNMATPNESSSYRHYNATERVHNKTMEEWTKFSVSLTDFRNNCPAPYAPHSHAPWDDHAHSLDNHKRCLKALFEFCSKLGVKYWTAFDTDLVPWTESWDELRSHWDEMVEYILEMGQRYHVKLMWLAPDLHSHPRYLSGALTSADATTFALAASQIKRCLEVSHRLTAECFLLWPSGEGGSLLTTDCHKEVKLFGKLLKITAEYKDRLNYRCQLLIMPYSVGSGRGRGRGRESRVQRYLWDCTSCLYLLRGCGMERYKLCAPPADVALASVYSMLGAVSISDDADPFDNRQMTYIMKCFIDQGSAPPGGISLQLHAGGAELRARIARYAQYMDSVSRGLRYAARLASDQLFTKYIQQKYASYNSGFGSRILNSDVSMEECEEFYKKNQSSHESTSKCHHMDLALQRFLDTSEHI